MPIPLACGDPLGMENHDIPGHSLLATGDRATEMRLNKPAASLILSHQVDEYVQVDLGPGGKKVTSVVIQGKWGSSNVDWISKFVLNYSRDGCEFSSYMENGVVKV